MKKVTILLAALFATCLGSSQNLLNGLQACYPLDGNANNGSFAGTSMDGSTSNVLVTSGQNNIPNTALYFQGVSGSMVYLPASSALKTSTVTVSFWFNADSIGGYTQFLITAPGSCAVQTFAYAVLLEDFGNDVFLVAAAQGTACGINRALHLNTLIKNKWYFVVAAFTADDIFINVDGAAESGPGVLPGHQAGSNVILGGNNFLANQLPFKGKMDQVRFYNRLLTTNEMDLLRLYPDLSCTLASGVSELNLSKVKPAYPNPCADILKVDENLIGCKITDLSGRCIFSKNLGEGQLTLDLSVLQSGLYFLVGTDVQGSTSTQKITIANR